MHGLFTTRFLVIFGIATFAVPRLSAAVEARTAPVPETVLSLLDKLPANTNHLAHETNDYRLRLQVWRSQDKWNYQEALGFLRKSTLPDITQCERVKTRPVPLRGVALMETTNQWLGLWATVNSMNRRVLMAADFLPFPPDALSGTTQVGGDFAEELDALASIFLRRVSVTNAGWNLSMPSVSRYRYWADSPVIRAEVVAHHTLCGLWLGLTNKVVPLFDSASFRLAFTNSLAVFMRLRAQETWGTGLASLQQGRPLTEVLASWQEHGRVFGANVFTEIPEYVSTLESQVAESSRLKDTNVEDPLTLAARDRAIYYVRRLSQAKRDESRRGDFKLGSPGPELVALGREALPVLLEHFEDRRLTGVPGDFSTKVVLVQDLALACFEQIVGGTFRTNYETSGKFSVLPQAKRKVITSHAREWLADYGDKHPAIGKLAIARPGGRLAILEDIESRYPGVVNSTDYLRRWAAEGRPDELRQLAWRLAWRGDHSMLTRVRRSVADGDCLNADYLSVFGDPEDYRLLQRMLRSQLLSTNLIEAQVMVGPLLHIAAGGDTNQFTPPPYILPILLDVMECRRLARASITPKTLAEIAFPGVLRLTGHGSDFPTNAPMPVKLATLDSWMRWWEEEGRIEFSARHPEVVSLFGRLEPEDGVQAPARLPQKVLALSAEPGRECVMPSAAALALARAGKLRLRLMGDGAIGRFLDPGEERLWISSETSPASKTTTNLLGLPAPR